MESKSLPPLPLLSANSVWTPEEWLEPWVRKDDRGRWRVDGRLITEKMARESQWDDVTGEDHGDGPIVVPGLRAHLLELARENKRIIK
jgi:hypothetical protein